MPSSHSVGSDLKQIAAQFAAVARKKRLSGKELTVLTEVRNRINEALQSLKECESCGAVVTNIAAIEIKGVRGRVCMECGIRALRSNQLKTKKPGFGSSPKPPREKKIAPQAKPAFGPQTAREIPSVSGRESAATGGTVEALAQETGHKAAVIRRIRKIAQDIAMPMNFEGTYNFTRAEVRKENIKLDDVHIRVILRRLADASEIRLRTEAA